MSFNTKDIFLNWKSSANDLGIQRFKGSQRKDLLLQLAALFFEHGVEYDEAKRYLKEVVDVLVTEKGKKGAGAYKGWKEKTESDYFEALASVYVNIEISEQTKERLSNKISDKVLNKSKQQSEQPQENFGKHRLPNPERDNVFMSEDLKTKMIETHGAYGQWVVRMIMPIDKYRVAFMQHKFGNACSEAMVEAVHDVMSYYNYQYEEANFASWKEPGSKEEPPEWFKKARDGEVYWKGKKVE